MEYDYEDIVKAIQDASMSQLPALLITVVEECHKKKAFNPGGIERCVQKTLERKEAIDAIGEATGGRRCEKCGAVMIHTRLSGYRCNRGCQ